MERSVGELATRLEGTLSGDPSIRVRGVADAALAQEGDLTFAENRAYFDQALSSKASAILVADDWEAETKVIIRVKQVRLALAHLLEWFHPEEAAPVGIHPSAVIEPDAVVDPTASIGPGCYVGCGGRIGAGTVLVGGVQVAANCEIGEDCKLFSNVVLYGGVRLGSRVRIHAGSVLGSDGYGYVFDGSQHRKLAQRGGVLVEDDVELGANVTIDRGAFGDTKIGAGSKIDNLVQLGHNVVVGRACIVIAQTGIAGSTSIGDHSIIAGQVGIAGHLKIGKQVTIAAQSGVMRDLPDGSKVFGSPSQDDRIFKRQLVALQQLPDLIKRVRELERRLEAQDNDRR